MSKGMSTNTFTRLLGLQTESEPSLSENVDTQDLANVVMKRLYRLAKSTLTLFFLVGMLTSKSVLTIPANLPAACNRAKRFCHVHIHAKINATRPAILINVQNANK